MKAAERYFEIRSQLDEIRRQEKELKEEQTKVEYEIINFLEENELEQVRTKAGSLTKNVNMYASVKSEEKPEFIKWAVASGRPDMMIVRPNDKAVREFYLDTGELPVGVETYMATKLNMRRS